jgi:type IV pilus assembly protein PilV
MPAMSAALRLQRTRVAEQRGSFMLEALIAILIVSLGVLGTVGLYARSVQHVDEAKFRGEAALLANTVIGQMWISDSHFLALQANFASAGGGPGYTEFATMVGQRLPNALPAPTVVVTAGPTATSSEVSITIFWRHPGEPATFPSHRYDVNATIGSNFPCPC